MGSIIGLLVALGLLLLMRRGPLRFRRFRRPQKPAVNPGESIYEDLRSRALKTTSEMLGIAVKEDVTVFGVVIDWNVGAGVATIVAFANGDASLYFSGGGAVLGAGTHESVRTAAIRLITVANDRFVDANPRQRNIVAEKDEVVFNLLTGHGVFFAKESVEHVKSDSSAWTETFGAANVLIEEIRRVQPDEAK